MVLVLVAPVPMDPAVVPALVVALLVLELSADAFTIPILVMALLVPDPHLLLQPHLYSLMASFLVEALPTSSVLMANKLSTTVYMLVSYLHLPYPVCVPMALVSCHAMKP